MNCRNVDQIKVEASLELSEIDHHERGARSSSKRAFDEIETTPIFAGGCGTCTGIQDCDSAPSMSSNKRLKPDSSRGKVFRSFCRCNHGEDDHHQHHREDDRGNEEKILVPASEQRLVLHTDANADADADANANDKATNSSSSSASSPDLGEVDVDMERESHLALSQILIKGPERCKYKSQDEIAGAPIDLAWHFVENVIDRVDKLQRSPQKSSSPEPDFITTVAQDELYFLVRNFLSCRDALRERGVTSADTKVEIAYHYTRQRCVDGIRQNGFVESSNGTFGRGIYLGRNPLAFHGRGDRGLLVAILRGRTTRVTRERSSHSDPHIREEYNTLVGNKLERPRPQHNNGNSSAHSSHSSHPSTSTSTSIPTFWDEIIVQKSSQCIPLISFNAALVDKNGDPSSRGNNILWHYHREMQRVLDLFFNNGEISKVCKSDIFPTRPQLPQASTHNSYPQYSSPVQNMSYYVSRTLNGNWQNDKDWHRRKQMIQYIVKLFKKDPSSFYILKEMFPKFPLMVKTLEVNLYRSAPSFEAYEDKDTLKHRLKDIIAQLAKRSRSQQPCATERGMDAGNVLERIVYTAPKDLDAFLGDSCAKLSPFKPICEDEECAICLANMEHGDDGIVKIGIPGCEHAFHHNCIKKALEMKPCCPICRRLVKEPKGTSPSGTMTITSKPTIYCAGFESRSKGTFEIKYEMHSNFQKQYHPNPGVFYLGTERIAYIPDNNDGAKLLKRLKYAWRRGLTFTVGTSLTTGKANSITWSAIHHKTSINGGVLRHGFPDNGFFLNCNSELDSLGVPGAIDCED